VELLSTLQCRHCRLLFLGSCLAGIARPPMVPCPRIEPFSWIPLAAAGLPERVKKPG
jgi:hypothetical protein